MDEIADSGVDLTIYEIQHSGDEPINLHQGAIFWLEGVYKAVRGRSRRWPGIPGCEPYMPPDTRAAIAEYVKENWPAVTERMWSLVEMDSDSSRKLALERSKAVAWEENKQQQERLIAGLAAGNNRKPTAVPDAPQAVPLTPEERTILEVLADEHGMTVTQEALAQQTHLSDKTVRKWIGKLRERGLVNQPRGPKKGFAITPLGLNAIGRN